MQSPISLVGVAIVCGVLTAAYAWANPTSDPQSAESQSAEGTAGKSYQELSDAAPVPSTSPYGDAADKAKQYTYGFRHGYTWAFGETPYCPTNPNDSNHAVMHGWIDGWRAGVKEGGANGLPSKYATFVMWRPSKKDGAN